MLASVTLCFCWAKTNWPADTIMSGAQQSAKCSLFLCVCGSICVSVHVWWRSASAVTCGKTILVTAVINSHPSQWGSGAPPALRQDRGLGHGRLCRYRSPSPPTGSTLLTPYLPLLHHFSFFQLSIGCRAACLHQGKSNSSWVEPLTGKYWDLKETILLSLYQTCTVLF